MNIVREYIEYMDFERTGDPLKSMGLGQKAQIAQWLDAHEVRDYEINSDLTIDVYNDVNLVGLDLEELPSFIKFNKIVGGFYAGGNPWHSLHGFPKEVHGDLQINSPSSPISPGLKILKFKNNIIRKLIKVNGKIWN